ncbi:hypothetical protein QN397_26310 [Variovorax sp. RTB1]|uniref:hypothetical protein n=1 Tax=Variovorax sp. RTB1 TaxID=3048631 RepID=UPI002B22B769|nr:hypothetical protein [Variovorax sp. RTB1]MEB0114787.1 hypothetical protein [Variovorax sp. RTB1]
MDILTVKRTKAGQIKRIVEYVNVETGEIIPGSTVPVLSLGVKLEQRSRILGKLRPEVRQFAAFVL